MNGVLCKGYEWKKLTILVDPVLLQLQGNLALVLVHAEILDQGMNGVLGK